MDGNDLLIKLILVQKHKFQIRYEEGEGGKERIDGRGK